MSVSHAEVATVVRGARALTMSVSQAEAATVVGYAIGAGSTCLYTPMIWRCLQRRSAAGLSAETWLIKLCAYTSNDLYNYSRHYPLSQYLESITLALQALCMLAIVCSFQRRAAPALAAVLVLVGGIALLQTPVGQEQGIAAMQTVAAIAGAGAVLPQIVLNLRRSSSGEFSPITASLLMCGNLVRAWTTVQLADGDVILLLGCGLGFVVNGTLFAQILYFASRDGVSLARLFSSDFAGPAAEAEAEEAALKSVVFGGGSGDELDDDPSDAQWWREAPATPDETVSCLDGTDDERSV
jgi:mannose-P-dolichol utilization defect protein 1